MPTGKVKWFDADKGFGFLSQDGGPDVYVHAEALPEGTAKTLKAGTRVEFGIAQGRRGDQALQVRILEAPKSVARNQRAAQRRKPEEMVLIVENVIKLLDDIREGYEHGRPPTRELAKKVSPALRSIADEFEL
ncbi:cold shock domain-containing protein [Nocardioides sp. BP30]|uniref:cold-shock protein n=1 Tax=Nocardioides sp. BP30 TaxID=3036374 RepID=UPI0024683078|nr:cold shock domain-containing protein [Nocardioides sp. BP30]WGL53176.1 cold shock domain-containing protein [Nocardioides sp. BP30]